MILFLLLLILRLQLNHWMVLSGEVEGPSQGHLFLLGNLPKGRRSQLAYDSLCHWVEGRETEICCCLCRQKGSSDCGAGGWYGLLLHCCCCWQWMTLVTHSPILNRNWDDLKLCCCHYRQTYWLVEPWLCSCGWDGQPLLILWLPGDQTSSMDLSSGVRFELPH